MNKKTWFSRFAKWASHAAGLPRTFLVALGAVVVWAALGPLFAFSDTWQLVINTSTTIITFLMVFLIQHTQNRDSIAIHLKLDELIKVTENAQNTLLDLEELEEAELEKLRSKYEKIASDAREKWRAEGHPIKEISKDEF